MSKSVKITTTDTVMVGTGYPDTVDQHIKDAIEMGLPILMGDREGTVLIFNPRYVVSAEITNEKEK